MNRVLVLENGFPIDVPKDLIKHLGIRGINEWEHIDMREKFWPENRESTAKLFFGLDPTDQIYCSTVFVDYQQLELMIQLLDNVKDKSLNIKLMVVNLPEDFLDFLNGYESRIVPRTKKYDNDPDLRAKFKADMDKKFHRVLGRHNIYWVRSFMHEEILIKDINDIINGLDKIGYRYDGISDTGKYMFSY